MAKKIVFLLGSANISGGTYVILQHALFLKNAGFDVRIALVFMTLDELKALKNASACWHPAIKELEFIHIKDAAHYQFDVAIYTWWAILFSFAKIKANTAIYFVQSIESRFYAKELTFLRDVVDRTYQLGLPVITEAVWIQKYLQHHYQNSCELVRNGILKTVYTEQGEVYAEKSLQQLRILVEGPVDLIFKNVARTVELCKQAKVGEVWLLTSSKVESYPGVDRVFSQVSIQDVPKIYRSCDVLVKLSYVEGMFGPPLEMFHCGGTAIVYDVTGFDEYIEHDVNALVAKTNDEEAVIRYLQALHQDRNLLERLIAGAKQTATNWIDWQHASQDFANAIEKIASHPVSNRDAVLANVKTYLQEHLDVTFKKSGKQCLPAVPLYQSGYYALHVPLVIGENIFSVHFGKLYKVFKIIKVELSSENGTMATGDTEIKEQGIIENNQGNFVCLTQEAGFNFNFKIRLLQPHKKPQLSLKIEFTPIQVAENEGVSA